jgi:ABC-type uncharacterized transport system involved in gliding motility auxiliary subunit
MGGWVSGMKAAIKFFLKYLVFLGVGLAMAGLIAGLVSGTWDVVVTGLLIAGVVLIGIWLLFIGRLGDPGRPKFWQRRSTQVGTNALVSTLSVLVILGLINFIAVRHVYRVDLTEMQLFSLVPETKQVLQSLKQPVKMYLFSRDRDPSDQALLDRLTDQTKKFSFEYVDPQMNPTLAQRFNLKNDLVNQDVFLERVPQSAADKSVTQLVQTINPELRLSESKIVNALIRVSSDRQPKIYFLQGHGEKILTPGSNSLSEAVQSLRDRNFLVEPLNLAQMAEIPADAAAIVIAGPRQPLFEPEIQLLEAYQNRGGSLLILLDPRTETGLDPLLKQWGILLDNRLAIDASGIGQQLQLGPAAPIVQTYSDHPITRSFGNSISFYPYAQPLEIVEVPNVRPNPIVLTNDRSWAEANPDEKPVKFTEGEDRLGPLPIGVALSRLVLAPATPSNGAISGVSPAPVLPNQEVRMVVFGSTGFAMDGYFNQAINGDVLINSISWLSQDDTQPLSVRPRSVKNRRIMVPQALKTGLLISSVIVVPLLGLLTAIALWWQRR